MNEEVQFEILYADFVSKYLYRELKISDGLTNKQISKVEADLGHKLPQALRIYYETIGNCQGLNKYHNKILDLDKIFVESGFLIFAEENQHVLYWGIKTESLVEINPTVWQIQNEEPPEYYSEEKTFTAFMTEMFEWQFNL